MLLPIYVINAFSPNRLGGNPAAVVPLPRWLPDAELQAIAAQNNLSETVYLVPEGLAWTIRWFTPVSEVDLCGHATLAAAFVVSQVLQPGVDQIEFRSPKSGVLPVRCEGARFTLDFPRQSLEPAQLPDALKGALGETAPESVYRVDGSEWLVVYAQAAIVDALRPRMDLLARHTRWLTATAPADPSDPEQAGVDFVSRFFAPAEGIPEDPVTGSAHCHLAPYWAHRLGKPDLFAQQRSARRGHLQCTVTDQRVLITGEATLYLIGTIEV
jgi:PhzF family phenazine biosynthesis protein